MPSYEANFISLGVLKMLSFGTGIYESFSTGVNEVGLSYYQ